MAKAAGRVVADTVTDAEKRQAVARAATPTYHAALDGAGLRNKKGKIKLWRVGRAAIRPRKTLTRVSQGVSGAAGVQAMAVIDAAAEAARTASKLPPTYFSVADICNEWTDTPAEETASGWSRSYERLVASDDPVGERSSLLDLCAALAACLKGNSAISTDDEIVATIGDVLSVVLAETDAEAWHPDDPRLLRVCLAVAQRMEVQPAELGGNDELAMFFDDEIERMRLAMAVSRRGWSVDLGYWFEHA